MKCPKCARTIADDSARCGWCGLEILRAGQSLPAPSGTPPATPVISEDDLIIETSSASSAPVESPPPPPLPPRRPSGAMPVPPPLPSVTEDITQGGMAPPPAPVPGAPMPSSPRRSHMTPAVVPPDEPYVLEAPPPKAPPPAFRYRGRRSGSAAGLIKWLVVLIVVAGLGFAGWFFGTRIIAARQAAADSTAAAARADSIRADSIQLASLGYLRVTGDLPDDAIVWVNGEQKARGVIQLAPGSYTLEIETGEFQPWERSITVRARDTTRIFVELELPQDTAQ